MNAPSLVSQKQQHRQRKFIVSFPTQLCVIFFKKKLDINSKSVYCTLAV